MDHTDDRTAEQRIKEAFLACLQPTGGLPEQFASSKLFRVLDDHFSVFCSFYSPEDRDWLRKNLERFILPFLNVTDYTRISVSALTRRAGVNRTTFYKCFPNVDALYDACCEDIAKKFLDVPVPQDKTEAEMLPYGQQLWRIMEENRELLILLSHRVGRRGLPYTIGKRLQRQLEESLSAQDRSSFDAEKNLDIFPELFSVWLGAIQINQIAPRLFPDRKLPVYRTRRSLIDNIADFFAARYGGQVDFYYVLGIAALKLLSEKSYKKISVSELCETAGYPRSAFYARFTDMADYIMKICENSVLVCVSAFCYFLQHQEQLTRETLETFRGEMVPFKIEGVRAIFRNGSITYLFTMMFAYLMRIILAQIGAPPDRLAPERVNALVSYYVSSAMRLFSMYYIGDMTDAELQVRKTELGRIKRELGM